MTIRVRCVGCEKTIKAPDKYRGREAACPGCGTPNVIEGLDDFDDLLTDVGKIAFKQAASGERLISATQEEAVCPFCAETIKADAKKCKHCGELLDQQMRAEQKRERKAEIEAMRPKASAGVAMVLSLIIPGAGQMYRGRGVTGLLWFFCVIVGYALLIVPGLFLHFMCIMAAGYEGTTRRP